MQPSVVPTNSLSSLDSKFKGDVHLITCHEGTEGEQSYGSTLSLISKLERSGWLTPRPGHFTPREKSQYSLYRGLGGPRAGLDGCRKSPPQ